MAVTGIILGMKYLHSQNIIHRNLKPSNILFDEERRVRIGDFGSSREYEVDVTMTGVGSPLYMAPEVYSGHYDEKVDVYSFGIIAYEIVRDDSVVCELASKIFQGERPAIPNDMNGFVRDMIHKCWSKIASERPTFEEIWNGLKTRVVDIFPGVRESDLESYLVWVEMESKGKRGKTKP
jgi:serine/threonine protein kinase